MNQTITRLFILLFLLGSGLSVSAQIETFEGFNLPDEAALDGSMANGGFDTDVAFWPNTYDFNFWLGGWGIATQTDTVTGDFSNLFSPKVGTGNAGSRTYAVGQFTSQIILKEDLQSEPLQGVYVTNTTFAYEVIENGNMFSKKFGGDTGDDPDYFLLTIFPWKDGQIATADSVDFYLADYRFEDNSLDYIVDTWEYVDLSSMGVVDSLTLIVRSTDNDPVYGINTPAYYCIDDFNAGPPVSTFERPAPQELDIYPTLTSEGVWINADRNVNNNEATLTVYDSKGQVIDQKVVNLSAAFWLATNGYSTGRYYVNVRTADTYWMGTFVQQ